MIALPASFLRFLHMAAASFNLAFIYTPLASWHYGLMIVRFVTMPLLIVTGYALFARRRKAHARFGGCNN